jgi:hypothetical protein
MPNIPAVLETLRRPRLLVRAARIGLAEYSRERDLRRVMKFSTPPSPQQALNGLLETEAELENRRRSGDASYSIARHVEVLVAVMAEARLLPSPQP